MAEFDSARAGPHGAGAPKEGKEQGDSLPKTERWCTDVVCLVIFVLHWIAFVVVTFAGSQYGNPAKLYRPRDFSGGYCGIGDFSAAEKMVLMMNLSTTVEPVAKQLVCSTAAMEALGSLWGASSLEYAGYLCACCLVACENCTQSLVQPDLADPWALLSTIGGRMGELTSLSAGASLFSSSSANFGSFSAEDVWSNIGTYFVQVCLADACAVPSASNFSGYREHVYSPAGDLPWKTAWDALTMALALRRASAPSSPRASSCRRFPRAAAPTTRGTASPSRAWSSRRRWRAGACRSPPGRSPRRSARRRRTTWRAWARTRSATS
ncbi:unnamed protein product [Prorocentrum cordatum]|uniref:Uncharacterized protein n=1 Tax=Prorocentrum cordatum TaxID=2364126 RepID=A0ABN9W0E4_9DINO|nr:unnamed protein product [Polarella glacialis]